MKYINENPTKTEKILFEKYGLYLIYKDEDSYRYAPIHIENQYVYPSSVEVENDMVEWEHDILFDIFTETVTIHGNYDSIDCYKIMDSNLKHSPEKCLKKRCCLF